MNYEAEPDEAKPSWQPLSAIDRRVAGVLIEKAKTTPDAYPLTINAIRTGSNQKSNRDPIMELSPEDVEDSLERLRELGAVTLIQGSGRVDKYRHQFYQWLGVEKTELAVMGELLLRGAQTEGELRGRAARMDPIPDLAALRPLLTSLKEKGLVVALNRQGRGHVVTHALYQPRELEKLKSQYGQATDSSELPTIRGDSPHRPPRPVEAPLAGHDSSEDTVSRVDFNSLRLELEQARQEISQLRADLDELRIDSQRSSDELARLRDALGG